MPIIELANIDELTAIAQPSGDQRAKAVANIAMTELKGLRDSLGLAATKFLATALLLERQSQELLAQAELELQKAIAAEAMHNKLA